jgi:signal transduction histidine kinase/putative methionine-R-sulfoxide reductase with GAF domain
MTLSRRDFELLVKANTLLSSKLEIGEVLVAVMELATEIVAAEASSILLLDERTNELYFDVALGRARAGLKQIRLRVGEGLAGWVAEKKAGVIANDVAHDSRWTSRADKATDFDTRSILAVPLTLKGRLIGVVEAINKKTPEGFSADDQQVLEAFAAQAAIAIENARLFSTLRQEKEKLSMVFLEMSDGAVLLDGERRIILANPSACACLGWEAAKILDVLLAPSLLPGFECSPSLEQSLLVQSAEVSFDWVRKAPTELRLAGIFHHLYSPDHGAVVGTLIVFRDVTEERREEKIKRAFLGLISHKLKTPLVPIIGYAEFLLNEGGIRDPRQRGALEAIQSQSLRLKDLVNKLLNFARLEAESIDLNIQSITLSECVRNSAAAFTPYFQQENVDFLVDESLGKMPSVQGDPELTSEVFKNLFENAVKFNPKPRKSVAVSARRDDGFVCVEVADDGPGLPPEELERVFQKFHQVDAFFTGQVPGAGLGLALCRRILRSQGGEISLKSHLGQGSRFSVFLKVAS